MSISPTSNKKPTYYEQFQISESASPEMIHAAYKVLAKKFHPDLCDLPREQSEAIMKEINAIYVTLSDSEKRKRYDQHLAEQRELTSVNTQTNYSKNEQSQPISKKEEQNSTQKSTNSFGKAIYKMNSQSIIGLIILAVIMLLWIAAIIVATMDGQYSDQSSKLSNSDKYTQESIISNNSPSSNQELMNENGASSTELTPISRPRNGEVIAGKKDFTESEITVTASEQEDCVVKLKTKYGLTVITFYVRAGQTASVGVPDSEYYVYFATGKTWYGEDALFGDNTNYSKDKDLCDFASYTYSYELNYSYSGNFNTTPVDENEFK